MSVRLTLWQSVMDLFDAWFFGRRLCYKCERNTVYVGKSKVYVCTGCGKQHQIGARISTQNLQYKEVKQE